ncbi:hypothetical protein AB0M50_44700 [Nonomuraea fuscirosea]|jgi:hypothetical protein|uniref:hypothetical protein n=1 Tax=Nonomuraea fuscirosea TaxID=1291556 RepID=UPI002DD8BC06|nr:hypothetical protein [Nonomuraea fuscirosea]WSA55615.1 hypothetical protein OIE67_13730 [Nonomuraea fuscirosea]
MSIRSARQHTLESATGYPRHAVRTDPDFPQRDYAWRHDWGGEGGAEPGLGVVALLTTPGDGREDS